MGTRSTLLAGRLWEESTGDRLIPLSKRTLMRNCDVFFEQTAEQTHKKKSILFVIVYTSISSDMNLLASLYVMLVSFVIPWSDSDSHHNVHIWFTKYPAKLRRFRNTNQCATPVSHLYNNQENINIKIYINTKGQKCTELFQVMAK